jgi:hypothetical protein
MIFLDLIIYTHVISLRDDIFGFNYLHTCEIAICYGMLPPVDHPANSFGAVEKVEVACAHVCINMYIEPPRGGHFP